jgi:hypothetical protein
MNGNVMSLPGRIALMLIEKWGAVTGKIRGEEDSAGRAVLDVMPVPDVIERAFDMAEQAVVELERRQWIRPVDKTPEQVGEAAGRIEQARYQKHFADKRASATPKE